MRTTLTSEAFDQLLDCLDANRERAGERYETLRRTLVRYFEWRKTPFPEEHADETLNRAARKLGEGVRIENVGAYCYEIARLVWLESTRGQDRRRAPLEEAALPAIQHDDGVEAEEQSLRLACLAECLRALPEESRAMITSYYQMEPAERISKRQALATKLGLRREALANRAQRLRDKLHECLLRCLRKKGAI